MAVPARRFVPRVSLLTALLGTTIAALAVALWQINREVAPLRAEVRQLRQELGHLSIDDPAKIYAIQVDSPDGALGRFRVHLPENRAFQIHLGLHEVAGRKPGQTRQQWLDDVGLKSSGSTGSVRSGEFTIDVEVRPDAGAAKDDQWVLSYNINNAGGGSVGTAIPWLEDRRAWSISGEAPRGRQVELPAEDGVVLFELRQAKVTERDGGYSTTSPDAAADAPGLIVYITPEPAAAVPSR